MPDNKLRVLLVEDSPEICSLVTFILEDFDVDSVSTAEAGLSRARTGGYCLIVLDHYLPDMLGSELCTLVRDFDRQTPILFVTNSPDIDDEEAIKLGASGVMRKSSNGFLSGLLPRVYELCGRSEV